MRTKGSGSMCGQSKESPSTEGIDSARFETFWAPVQCQYDAMSRRVLRTQENDFVVVLLAGNPPTASLCNSQVKNVWQGLVCGEFQV